MEILNERGSMTPLVFKKEVILPLPTPDDRRAYDERLADALGLGPVSIPLSIMKRLPAFGGRDAAFPCIIGRTGNGLRVIDIGCERSYSIALDLGTTNLVALLHDNVEQKDVLKRSLENPQIKFGSDILTRMHHVMTGRAEEVYNSLIDGVNSLIALLCKEAGIDANEIHAVAVAGNTVMSHFFLGLDIGTIPVDPFVPVVRTPGFFLAAELRLTMNREGLVYTFPNAGSYVGGDIIAGIMASDMDLSDRTSILIDVGTNAEVVIGNRDWMIVGAGAAGPALEEGICRIGKRAKGGIVHDVEIRDGNVSCSTFDKGKPEGICGSGMVSLLYELYKAGFVDESGTLAQGGRVADIDGEKAFFLDCDSSGGLFITQNELRNFMKSKAAMFTLLLVLTRAVGVSFGDIENVYVSGALGTGIDPKKAAGIGMLPAWRAEIVKPLGNSSLAGARMLLRDGALVDRVNSIVGKITYKHMHDDPEFMKEYLGAVFIPHTNPEMLQAG
jgi:uncharacterized 2Fe-2S/4Fe-4S cluster protein (DUF4445 family)